MMRLMITIKIITNNEFILNGFCEKCENKISFLKKEGFYIYSEHIIKFDNNKTYEIKSILSCKINSDPICAYYF